MSNCLSVSQGEKRKGWAKSGYQRYEGGRALSIDEKSVMASRGDTQPGQPLLASVNNLRIVSTNRYNRNITTNTMHK
jgi:hypothetical protein